MKKLLVAVSLAAFSLAGCATDPTTGRTTLDLSQAQALFERVKTLTSVGCGVVPYIEDVAAIFASGNPLLSGATAVANAICDKVLAKQFRRSGTQLAVTVGGVPVRLNRVR